MRVSTLVMLFGAVVFVLAGCVVAGAGPDGDAGGGPVEESPEVGSNFSADLDGWGTYNDATGLAHDPAGAYIYAVDQASGAWWYFAAPSEFLGDKEAYYGGTLSYELLMLTGTPNTGHGVPEIVLVGGPSANPIELEVDLGIQPNSTDWTTFSVELSAAADWMNGGAPATEAEIREVLRSLTALRICGEYVNGGDSSALRNVVMSGP